MDVPDELIAILQGARHLVAAGHTTPDVDALGSILALSRAHPADDNAITLGDKPISRRLQFMIDMAGVPVVGPDAIAPAELIVVADTAGPNRLNVTGGFDAVAGKTIVNIDHHLTNQDFGTHNWVVDNASSTCEVMYHLIRRAGWRLDPTSATLLYAGIHADTCGFSLPSATTATFETATELVRAGADIETIGTNLCRSLAMHHFDLVRKVYHNTRLAGQGRIAYSTLTYDEILNAGCTPEDIDDQVSIPRSLSGIRMAMLLSEADRDVVRINLRGEHGTRVLALAERLGGGGHEYSAGVRVRGPLNDVVARVIGEAERFLADDGSSAD